MADEANEIINVKISLVEFSAGLSTMISMWEKAVKQIGEIKLKVSFSPVKKQIKDLLAKKNLGDLTNLKINPVVNTPKGLAPLTKHLQGLVKAYKDLSQLPSGKGVLKNLSSLLNLKRTANLSGLANDFTKAGVAKDKFAANVDRKFPGIINWFQRLNKVRPGNNILTYLKTVQSISQQIKQISGGRQPGSKNQNLIASYFGGLAPDNFRKAALSIRSFAFDFYLIGGAIQNYLINPLRGASHEFGVFEQNMQNARVLSGASETSFGAVRQQVDQLARSTRFGKAQLSEIVDEMARAGFAAKDLKAGLQTTVDLADAVGKVSQGAQALKDANSILIEASFAFQNQMAGMTKQEQFTKVSNLISAAANATKADLLDFNYFMNQVAGSVASTGSDFEEAVAIFAGMKQVMPSGRMAASALNQAFVQLANLPDEAIFAEVLSGLERIGLTARDIQPEVVGLKKAIDNIALIRPDQALLNKIFGVEGSRTFKALQALGPEYDRIASAVGLYNVKLGSLQSTEEIANEVRKTAIYQFQILSSNINAGVLEVLGVLAEEFKNSAQQVTNFLEIFREFVKENKAALAYWIKFSLSVVAFVAVVHTAGVAISSLTNAFAALYKVGFEVIKILSTFGRVGAFLWEFSQAAWASKKNFKQIIPSIRAASAALAQHSSLYRGLLHAFDTSGTGLTGLKARFVAWRVTLFNTGNTLLGFVAKLGILRKSTIATSIAFKGLRVASSLAAGAMAAFGAALRAIPGLLIISLISYLIMKVMDLWSGVNDLADSLDKLNPSLAELEEKMSSSWDTTTKSIEKATEAINEQRDAYKELIALKLTPTKTPEQSARQQELSNAEISRGIERDRLKSNLEKDIAYLRKQEKVGINVDDKIKEVLQALKDLQAVSDSAMIANDPSKNLGLSTGALVHSAEILNEARSKLEAALKEKDAGVIFDAAKVRAYNQELEKYNTHITDAASNLNNLDSKQRDVDATIRRLYAEKENSSKFNKAAPDPGQASKLMEAALKTISGLKNAGIDVSQLESVDKNQLPQKFLKEFYTEIVKVDVLQLTAKIEQIKRAKEQLSEALATPINATPLKEELTRASADDQKVIDEYLKTSNDKMRKLVHELEGSPAFLEKVGERVAELGQIKSNIERNKQAQEEIVNNLTEAIAKDSQYKMPHLRDQLRGASTLLQEDKAALDQVKADISELMRAGMEAIPMMERDAQTKANIAKQRSLGNEYSAMMEEFKQEKSNLNRQLLKDGHETDSEVYRLSMEALDRDQSIKIKELADEKKHIERKLQQDLEDLEAQDDYSRESLKIIREYEEELDLLQKKVKELFPDGSKEGSDWLSKQQQKLASLKSMKIDNALKEQAKKDADARKEEQEKREKQLDAEVKENIERVENYYDDLIDIQKTKIAEAKQKGASDTAIQALSAQLDHLETQKSYWVRIVEQGGKFTGHMQMAANYMRQITMEMRAQNKMARAAQTQVDRASQLTAGARLARQRAEDFATRTGKRSRRYDFAANRLEGRAAGAASLANSRLKKAGGEEAFNVDPLTAGGNMGLNPFHQKLKQLATESATLGDQIGRNIYNSVTVWTNALLGYMDKFSINLAAKIAKGVQGLPKADVQLPQPAKVQPKGPMKVVEYNDYSVFNFTIHNQLSEDRLMDAIKRAIKKNKNF